LIVLYHKDEDQLRIDTEGTTHPLDRSYHTIAGITSVSAGRPEDAAGARGNLRKTIVRDVFGAGYPGGKQAPAIHRRAQN